MSFDELAWYHQNCLHSFVSILYQICLHSICIKIVPNLSAFNLYQNCIKFVCIHLYRYCIKYASEFVSKLNQICLHSFVSILYQPCIRIRIKFCIKMLPKLLRSLEVKKKKTIFFQLGSSIREPTRRQVLVPRVRSQGWSLHPGVNFVPWEECSPLRSPPGVNTLYSLEETRSKLRILSPRVQLNPEGSKFNPGSHIPPLESN
jgi:hypothetical protein